METWLFFAIASIFFAGGFNFMMKVISYKKYNISYISVISYIFAFLINIIYIFLYGIEKINFEGIWIIIILAFFNTLFYFFSTITRIKSLDNIETTLFFPIYKTFSPIFVMFVSLLYFGEALNLKELLGILIGISVPLLLITRSENKIQKNLKLGLILVILTSIFATVSTGFTKEITVNNLDVNLFVLFSMFFGIFISIFSYKIFDKKTEINKNKTGIFKYGLILGFLHFFSFYTFSEAVRGNLAIVFTINSFSILIPIILSVIFYKENMTYKKAFVIFLSIISMLLFI